ncbi:hypothetical protein B296_00014045 [Ensete ventricosum]|uniref:Uncharacterized protein n=1 Tax=Ensete ventricosum TaxID=4639 RepID=A0A427B1P4_ENSVE|nr:hypothetical protein B296_00014045 [Ensete ventricosum]
MVCTIPASAWTWLVRPRKASAVTMRARDLMRVRGTPGRSSSSKNGWGLAWQLRLPPPVEGELGLGGRLLELWSPGEEGVLQFGSVADSCKKVGSGRPST